MPSIATYLRVRPANKENDDFEVTEDEPNVLKARVTADKLTAMQGQGGAKMEHRFKYARIFGQETKQEEVFETVGQRVCDRFLEGYNCTVFAYGQTGSGKTFTIEGGFKSFADRGLLPRCLTYIYDQLNSMEVDNLLISITYLEIYNDTAYDLLSASSGVSAKLPKVSVSDHGTSVKVHNLSTHPAPTVDVAENLMFMGRTNRTVASTSMNMASSRSHSIFTITVSFRKPGTDTIIRSKLNLVDLAGSERVSKSNAVGQQLKEARHINLSLHYLQAVIIALQQQGHGKKHVPYRNSLLTKLLRDSLGGNCLTAMIATISIVPSNAQESISTCRFSQRVALIDNNAKRNEVLDDKTVIKRLRRRIAELNAELQVAQEVAAAAKNGALGGDVTMDSEDTEVDRHQCAKLMKQYVHGKLRDPLAAVPKAHALRYCFEILRSMILEQRQQVDELEQSVEEGLKSKEQLRLLKEKFGVTRARMRNLESSIVSPSQYGKKRKKKPRQPARLASLGEEKQPSSTSSGTGTPAQSRSQRGRGTQGATQSLSLSSSSSSTLTSQRSSTKSLSERERARGSGRSGPGVAASTNGGNRRRQQQQSKQGPSRRQREQGRGVQTHVGQSRHPQGQQRRRKKGNVNRSQAQKTLILIGRKEQELTYALEDLSERVEQQRQVMQYCQRYAPHRLLGEQMRSRELEEDQAQVAAQLIELQNGRMELEDALGISFDSLAEEEEGAQPQTLNRTYSAEEMSQATRGQQKRQQGSRRAPGNSCSTRATQQPVESVALPDAIDPRLTELRSKEEKTRAKLAALKAEIMRESTQMGIQLRETSASTEPPSRSATTLSSGSGSEPLTRAERMRREGTMPPIERDHPLMQPSSNSNSNSRNTNISPTARHRPRQQNPKGRASPAHSRSTSSPSQPTKSPSPSSSSPSPKAATQQTSSKFLTKYQKQRDRVARIRKAIHAATVIQRAWRKYKNNPSSAGLRKRQAKK